MTEDKEEHPLIEGLKRLYHKNCITGGGYYDSEAGAILIELMALARREIATRPKEKP